MPERLRFFKKHQYLGKFFCLAYKDGEKELKRDIEGNAIMILCGGDMMKEEMIIQFLDSLNKTMDGE